jgi:hypothetical protein
VVTHERLAVFLGLVAPFAIAGFSWMTYVAWEIHRNTRALAALGYQESEKTRAAIGRLDR